MKTGPYSVSLLLLLLMASAFSTNAQEQGDSVKSNWKAEAKKELKGIFQKREHTFNYNIFSQLYPIRDNPTVGFRTSYNGKEFIMFDVHPVLSLSLYNNFKRQLKAGTLFSHGYCFTFRPQFRMYKETSTPVKMPSYKVLIGLQHLYRISQKHLVSYSIESGHYSNGQSGSALISNGRDQSPSSDSAWAALTPQSKLSDIINRTDGDFSTNLSELMVNYRFIPKLDAYSRPQQVHSFTTGFVYYHNRLFGIVNAGGYTNESIAIYGHWRFLLSYCYSYNWKSGYRMTFSENLEVIQGAHPSVNPVRTVTQATFYLRQSLGFFVSYIYGHDDYNLRFVDSGHQFGVGLTWDVFPPIEIGKHEE